MKQWMASLVAGLAAGAALLIGAHAQARTLDLDKPADALQAFRKIQCTMKDETPAFYHWSGRAYSRVQGERDRLLFRVEGMNVRQCTTVTDPERGTGFTMVSREIMLYLDPKTGEVLQTWENPWTGKSVEVLHVANDPVNFRGPMFPMGSDGKPYSLPGRIDEGVFLQEIEVPLFYDNPPAGDYQEQVGNHYHAMEMFNFIVDADDLLNSRNANALTTVVSWVRVASWLPWMNMGSRPGIMIINTTGKKVGTYDQLPAVLKAEIAKNYPEYTAPPPMDDARPNETSWTVYKKWADEKRSKQGGDEPAKSSGH